MTAPLPTSPLARHFLGLACTGQDPLADHILELGLRGPVLWEGRVSALPPLPLPDAEPMPGQPDGRPSGAVLRDLLARIGPDPVRIVAHHAARARAFLEALARREGIALPEIHWTCTLEQVQALAPGAPFRCQMEDLAAMLGWDGRGLHRAGRIAVLTRRLQHALDAWKRVQASLGPDPGLVYLAGPLRGDGSPAAIRHNQAAMTRLCRWAQAVLPRAVLVVPHLNFAYLDESGPGGLEVRIQALRACEKLVARCDALVVCGETLTEGMRLEQGIAQCLALPVFQVPRWDPPAAAGAPAQPGPTALAG